MKQEKSTANPPRKKKSTKMLENPVTMRVQDMLLHHAPEVSAKILKNGPQKSPQQSHFSAVFQRDPSLPISVSNPFSSAYGIE